MVVISGKALLESREIDIVLWIVGQSKTIKEMISQYFKDPGAFAEKVKNGGAGILPDYAPPGTQADPPRLSALARTRR